MASSLAGAMSDVLASERVALGAQGGVTDGSLAVNEKPSTPRQPADVRPERMTSFDPAAFPRPTGREEEWRFTPLDRIRVLLDAGPSVARLSVTHHLPPGVELLELPADDPVLRTVPEPADLLAALAQHHAAQPVVIRIPAGAELSEPVMVTLTGDGGRDVVWGHIVIDVGARASAQVVLEHEGSARYAAAVSVLLGAGAHLDLVQVQAWDDDSVHAAHVGTRVGRDARLRSTQISLGGATVRVTETVSFAGPGGDVELNGVSFADDHQHLEHRLFVDHGEPHCRSRVTYKSALQGAQAHTVWVGDVLIRSGAVGTDTYELNRNLLLTPEARADSVPNLEIETGEIVGAGHASATGRFDDEQLFYLMSRGIPRDTARRMVVQGFFADVIGRIGVSELEGRLLAAVDAELGR